MAESQAGQSAGASDVENPAAEPAAGVPSGEPAPADTAASILFVGDLVGSIGRRTLLECLPILRERYAPTFVVVNGENVAGGLGITPKAARSTPTSTTSRGSCDPRTTCAASRGGGFASSAPRAGRDSG
jgi:hypothetical protein